MPDKPPVTAGVVSGKTTTAVSISRETTPEVVSSADAVVCERCGKGMFRMHAVWRCPGCGYKTDCCGW